MLATATECESAVAVRGEHYGPATSEKVHVEV